MTDEGYLKVAGIPKKAQNTQGQKDDETEDVGCDTAFLDMLKDLKKGSHLPVKRLMIKEGETSPPKRYNSGSLILAMENAGSEQVRQGQRFSKSLLQSVTWR